MHAVRTKVHVITGYQVLVHLVKPVLCSALSITTLLIKSMSFRLRNTRSQELHVFVRNEGDL